MFNASKELETEIELRVEIGRLREEIERLRAALVNTRHAITCATLQQGMAYGPCDCGKAALERKE